MSDPFDPARFRNPGPWPPAARPAKALPRHRPGEAFLKGPIPWAWLEAAAALPGRALAVGLVIWQEAGCRKNRTVTLTLARARRLGGSENAARRAVRHLAGAGLVAVEHLPGRGLRVTVLDPGRGLNSLIGGSR